MEALVFVAEAETAESFIRLGSKRFSSADAGLVFMALNALSEVPFKKMITRIPTANLTFFSSLNKVKTANLLLGILKLGVSVHFHTNQILSPTSMSKFGIQYLTRTFPFRMLTHY